MIDVGRYSLNRIVCPSLDLADFFSAVRELGLGQVELRNDIRDGTVLDGMQPGTVSRLARENGLRVITINALQKFNIASCINEKLRELQSLLVLAQEIGCGAIVMCPNNDPHDQRNDGERYSETVHALKSLAPLFSACDIIGLVEPLGFSISSLASVEVAQRAIHDSGSSCYQIVFDTFHHAIGPDTEAILRERLDVSLIGLIHVSGVERDIPKNRYLDAHRILPGPADRLKSKQQVETLLKLGYAGPISLEPFAESVQKLPRSKLVTELKRSIDYLRA